MAAPLVHLTDALAAAARAGALLEDATAEDDQAGPRETPALNVNEPVVVYVIGVADRMEAKASSLYRLSSPSSTRVPTLLD
jgi:hypothetical protein